MSFHPGQPRLERCPCSPTQPDDDCRRCERFQPHLDDVEERDAIVLLDASITRQGRACGMFSARQQWRAS